MGFFLCLHCVSIDRAEHTRLLAQLTEEAPVEDGGEEVDTGSVDTGSVDTGSNDTGSNDTVADTSVEDTEQEETGASGIENTHYVTLSGDEQYIALAPTVRHILDWHQDWSFSVYLPTSKGEGVLIANGENWIGFEKAGGRTEVWIAGSDFAPISDDFSGSIRNQKRVTITYEASSRALSVYVQADRTYYAEDIEVGAAPPNGTYPLSIGMYENDEIRSHWKGEPDQAIFLRRTLSEEEVVELYEAESIPALSFYDELGAWWSLGEADFPRIEDHKGEYDGFYQNGSAEDFIPY